MHKILTFLLCLVYGSFVFCHEPEANPIIQSWKNANKEFKNNDLESAYSYYNEAINLAESTKTEKDYIFLYTERAMINDSLKKYSEAIADWTKVIDLSPHRSSEVFDAHWNRGLAYHSLGDEENLVRDFTYVWQNDQRSPRYKQTGNIIEIDNINWNHAPTHEKDFIVGMFKRMNLITCEECINVSPSGKCILTINRPNPDHPCCEPCAGKALLKDNCRCDYWDDREKERRKKEEEIRTCKDRCTRLGVLAAPVCSYLKYYPCKAACATAVAELTRQCNNCCDYDSWYDACLRPLERFVQYPQDWRDCDDKEEQREKQRGW